MSGARGPAAIALATCARGPGLDPDEADIVEALEERGVRAEVIAWDAPTDWSAFDLVVIRSAWDYVERIAEFLSWVEHVSARTRLENCADVVRANFDKRYLATLGDAGVPIVPTHYFAPSEAPSTLPWDVAEFVVKPTVSAGSRDTFRCGRSGIAEHLAQIHATGRTAMVQPYIDAVDHEGESSVVFLGGEFSHGFHKGPMLADVDGHSRRREERISSHRPSAAELTTASQCRDALRVLGIDPDDLLYARIDLVQEGTRVLEVELIEPALNLSSAQGALDRFVGAVIAAAGA